jgi:hypothetical protein
MTVCYQLVLRRAYNSNEISREKNKDVLHLLSMLEEGPHVEYCKSMLSCVEDDNDETIVMMSRNICNNLWKGVSEEKAVIYFI